MTGNILAAVSLAFTFLAPAAALAGPGSAAASGPEEPAPCEMILVPGGEFRMGDVWGLGAEHEKPVHRVRVSDFWLGRFEVTQKLYAEIMGENPSHVLADDLPADYMTWYDAIEFCNRLSEREGLTPCYRVTGREVEADWSADGFRLPTEAEWEYAARGGGRDDRPWSGTDSPEDLRRYAWYWRNSGDGFQTGEFIESELLARGCRAHPVGGREPNGLGLCDMSGNVFEWCWDRYDPGYYSVSAAVDPRGPAEGAGRVLRGGQWSRTRDNCRTSFRFHFDPDDAYAVIGFRVARGAGERAP